MEPPEPADRQPTDELPPEVYAELVGLARASMTRLRTGQTLAPTVLVHEAVARLAHRGEGALAINEAMKRVLRPGTRFPQLDEPEPRT